MHIHTDSAGLHSLTLNSSTIPQGLDLQSLNLELWGTPWNPSHDGERGSCLDEANANFPWALCPPTVNSIGSRFAYITMPTACSSSLPFTLSTSSWQQPGTYAAQAVNRNASNQPVAVSDCEGLSFKSHPELTLTTQKASSATGLTFRLANQDEGLVNPQFRISSQAKQVVTALPKGLTVNPSVGAGLGSCTRAQYDAETAFNPQGAGCPNAAKIGDFNVQVAFFQGTLTGSIYLAAPDNPSTPEAGAENSLDSLLTVYLIAKSADRGILIKVAGKLLADPADGSLTAVFDGLPQLPYTNLEVNFRSGQRAPLITPPNCGTATSHLEIIPWAGTSKAVVADATSQITSGSNGGKCPTETTPPFSPTIVTGGVNSNVGSYTPYFVHLSRQDTEQEFTSYGMELPKGITGRLAGIPFCSDAAIQNARGRRGFDEIANPACPAASQVGRVDSGYGVGPSLTYAAGKIYLAGPYHGRPLSLVTINPAVVGPFDLGTIVVRSAFSVDPHTAQLELEANSSDPIPHIIDGIPLHLRDIRIYLDRDQFTHNPSSCEESQMISTVSGSGASFGDPSDESTVKISKHFQMLNCLTLGFEPKLGLRLRGGSKRGTYPSLRASYVTRGAKDSNLQRLEVTMPHALFLAQNHIRAVCTRVQFAAEQCPEKSVYGSVLADTPLFDKPLRGDVYLRSSSHRAPDLVASLRSGEIRIVIEGAISSSKDGGIYVYFESLPDAPITRFVMTLDGGRRGLLVNSSNVCTSPPTATVSALGQNNVGARFDTVLRGQCKRRRGHGPAR